MREALMLKVGKLYKVVKSYDAVAITFGENIFMFKTASDVASCINVVGRLKYGTPFLLVEIGEGDCELFYRIIVSDVIGWINMRGVEQTEQMVEVKS